MGGEKLKSFRPYLGAFFAVLFIFTGFFGITFPLSAQTPESEDETGSITREAAVDESTIILGETVTAPAPENGSSIFIVLRMVLVLALAALAIYGVVFFIKRLARPQEIRDPNLKVLARVPLGSDSFAAVISVGARAWLVGGGSSGVSLISEIEETESLETMLLDDARRNAEQGGRRIISFRALISKLGGSRDRGSGVPRTGPGPFSESGSLEEGGSLSESLRKQRERLKGLQ